jgi:hypothetical protein
MIDAGRTSSYLQYRTGEPPSFVLRELCVRFSNREKTGGKTQKLRRPEDTDARKSRTENAQTMNVGPEHLLSGSITRNAPNIKRRRSASL